MELKSHFFNGKTYNATDFANANSSILTNGISAGINDFKTTVLPDQNTSTISIGTGSGVINGYTFLHDAAFLHYFDVRDFTRIDTVVIRLDKDQKTIELLYVIGDASGVATPPTRTAAVYDMVIAQIPIAANATAYVQGDIIDTRANSSLCGIMATRANTIDITTYLTQEKTNFTNWMSHLTDELTANQAYNLQFQVDVLEDKTDLKIEKINEIEPDTNKNVALTLDNIPDGLLRSIAGVSGLQIQKGTLTTSAGSGAVTFLAEFTSVPTILCTCSHANNNTGETNVSAKSTTGFTVRATVFGNNYTGPIDWVAIAKI